MKSYGGRRAWTWLPALMAVIALGGTAHAQVPTQTPPPAGAIDINTPKPVPTGVIRGRITTFPDGAPLSRARVILSRPAQEHSWVVLTGEDGGFEITELEDADNYMLSASKTGHAPRMWGEHQLPTPPTPLTLAAGQVLEGIDVALAPHLWVSGKILDSDGTPFAGAIVSALRPVFVEDRREMVTVAEIITNDRGEYRLFGLPAGQYFISAVDPAFLATRDHLGP
ncbi:MAG: carboxypeptidase regulatory-like domain-containing protein, partial [Acidobacteria bacterium]|nr:carboxypeptidase regulatory-like domain-containing protein [Acidobacteriota bacterium]